MVRARSDCQEGLKLDRKRSVGSAWTFASTVVFRALFARQGHPAYRLALGRFIHASLGLPMPSIGVPLTSYGGMVSLLEAPAGCRFPLLGRSFRSHQIKHGIDDLSCVRRVWIRGGGQSVLCFCSCMARPGVGPAALDCSLARHRLGFVPAWMARFAMACRVRLGLSSGTKMWSHHGVSDSCSLQPRALRLLVPGPVAGMSVDHAMSERSLEPVRGALRGAASLYHSRAAFYTACRPARLRDGGEHGHHGAGYREHGVRM